MAEGEMKGGGIEEADTVGEEAIEGAMVDEGDTEEDEEDGDMLGIPTV